MQKKHSASHQSAFSSYGCFSTVEHNSDITGKWDIFTTRCMGNLHFG